MNAEEIKSIENCGAMDALKAHVGRILAAVSDRVRGSSICDSEFSKAQIQELNSAADLIARIAEIQESEDA